MKKLTLTMLDTSGIQDYIFNSNRLQENIGASELVYRATTLWAFKAMQDVIGNKHNIQFDDHQWSYMEELQIENDKDGLDAEVIYAGGGNTFILFRDEEQARQTIGRLTRRILKEAPNLTLVARIAAFEWGKDDLRHKREELIQALAAHKQSRQPSVPMLGLGVSAVCQSTGLPAVRNDTGSVKLAIGSDEREIDLRLHGQQDEPPRLISREIVAKLTWRDIANERLEKELNNQLMGYDIPSDVDKLGRLLGDESYVAVVHADGNRMGDHLNKAVPSGTDARAAITALRNFSNNVNTAGLNALRRVVELTAQAVKDGRIPNEENHLPLRPLVFGGDDVTLICNGQIGVSLAAAYLKAFEEETDKHELNKHSPARFPIVKMHYPFARAYTLSEELASSAKKFIKSRSKDSNFSALDWHYATGGLSGELDNIREREYEINQNPFAELLSDTDKILEAKDKKFLLTMRPVALWKKDAVNGRSWHEGIKKIVDEFNDQHAKKEQEKYWSKRKNKVIGLREPLRKGPRSVSNYLTNFTLRNLPEILSDTSRTGWVKVNTKKDKVEFRCVYFDAVELFDQYLPLEQEG